MSASGASPDFAATFAVFGAPEPTAPGQHAVAHEELRCPQADVLVRRAVKAVAANVPLRGDIPIDGVRRGRGRQVVEERGVEDRDVRQIRQQP